MKSSSRQFARVGKVREYFEIVDPGYGWWVYAECKLCGWAGSLKITDSTAKACEILEDHVWTGCPKLERSGTAS